MRLQDTDRFRVTNLAPPDGDKSLSSHSIVDGAGKNKFCEIAATWWGLDETVYVYAMKVSENHEETPFTVWHQSEKQN